ncbi:bifunctional NUDIX hydrolase/histidine phosphatase family protein [Micromonospora sp. WMMD1102]|uniref:NUDIX hydrolase n=1 Tax=Micromonospora sp. WMMD1102 TaxID=3016105 RepID=UPI00241567EA|nr:bifunctional NUDIX hydrolase/histidine phosphatase family protein [Micromonospora sp. WMMD1102]MDG4785515.1 bifunctional NUDIX hydrolase/histidine phosphatase family protein [Micromonospora sp. WMMD1102]
MAAVTPVRAAGGVVWRHSPAGVRVCLVHRPRYDDWSLPKGKLDPGEHPLTAAVREVAEEADVLGVPQVRLRPVHYLMRDGAPKTVEFWSMRAAGSGGFQPGTEVDDVRWLPLAEAVRLVSYPHDVAVLEDFAALPQVSAELGLVRHASAGKRGTWSGPDTARPLDDAGVAQSRELAGLLAPLRPVRLHSAAARRCVQTLQPLAELLDRPIEVDSAHDEPKPGQDEEENALAAAAALLELARYGEPAAVCSQGKVIPQALLRLAAASTAWPGAAAADESVGAVGPERLPGSVQEFRTAKGTGWLLAFGGDRLVAASRLDAADRCAVPAS